MLVLCISAGNKRKDDSCNQNSFHMTSTWGLGVRGWGLEAGEGWSDSSKQPTPNPNPNPQPLKNDVEIKPKSRLVASKKYAVIRIGDIGMNLQRVEMVGKIETTHREPQHILIAHLDVL